MAARELWAELLDTVEADGRTRLEQVFDVLLSKAAEGVPWAVALVVQHALPRLEEHEIFAPAEEPDPEALLHKLEELARRHGGETEEPRGELPA